MNKLFLHRMFAGVCAAVLATCAAAMPCAAVGETPEDSEVTTFNDGILTYTIIDDSRFVEISSCISTATNVNILPKLDGYTIVSIAEGAFAGCTDLQSVTMPINAELTEIGAYAFAECTSLKKVALPNTITEIPTGMFAFCSSLEEVTFGENIATIGVEAFRECTSLKEVHLPETVTSVGNAAYYMCTSLENISIPASLESFGAYSLATCVNLTEFHIPKTLTTIGDGMFLGCMGLSKITVDENHPNYKVEDGILYSKDGATLYFYPPSRTDTTFQVPAGVTDIYDGAFFQCSNLQYVEFPEGLEIIGAGSFDYCTALTAVVIPESVTSIMSTAFADCTSLERLTFVGADNETDGAGASLTIGDHAFYACPSLSEVLLPERTAEIGEYAFGCIGIVDDAGNEIPSAVENFMLRGFASAEEYIKECDVNVGFSPRHFPWKTMVFWVIAAAAVIVIVFFAVRIVKKNMMTPEEREALRQAREEQRLADEAADAAKDDGYTSILGDEGEEEKPTDCAQEDDAQAVENFLGTTPILLHHRGHSDENTK